MQRMRLGIYAWAATGLFACAAKLPHDKVLRAPSGQGKAIDLSSISFSDLATDTVVNLQEYMQASNRDYLMLVFGSNGCSTCNGEASLLDDMLSQNTLNLGDTESRFEVIGISTDLSKREARGFASRHIFIRWADPKAEMMRTYFLPAGLDVKVPLTAMVSAKNLLLWQILPDDAGSVTQEQLVRKIKSTVGESGDQNADQPSGPTPKPDVPNDKKDPDPGNNHHEIPATDLAAEAPGRLGKVPVTRCDGVQTNLEEQLQGSDIRFVQIVKKGCDSICIGNRQILADLACNGQKICQAVTLTMQGLDQDVCTNGGILQGGGEFFQVFKTHFDWAYTPYESGPPKNVLLLPEVEGPLVLGFAKSGRLIYSAEGALSREALNAEIRSDGFGRDYARGPDFALFDARGEWRFADWRRQAKLTVVNNWGEFCSDCVKELKKWSEPGELFDYCHARPKDCQLGAVESGVPDAGQSLSEYHQSLVAKFSAPGKEVRVPILVDPVPNPDDENYQHRLFAGYFTALFPEWGNVYRTVIYDREGKIIAAFKSEAIKGQDPVLQSVKAYLEAKP